MNENNEQSAEIQQNMAEPVVVCPACVLEDIHYGIPTYGKHSLFLSVLISSYLFCYGRQMNINLKFKWNIKV